MARQPTGWDTPGDPRPAPGAQSAPPGAAGRLRPLVAGGRSAANLWIVVGSSVLLGLAVLLFLISRRHEPDEALAKSGAAPVSAAAEPPPADFAMIEAQGRGTGLSPTPQAPPPFASAPAPALSVPGPLAGSVAGVGLDVAQRRRAPALVVDLDTGPGAPVNPAESAGAPAGQAIDRGAGSGNGVGPKAAAPQLNGDEQFAERIGTSEPDRAQATMLGHPHSTVAQGTMIPAVLETAMNSDLPGFVRAVVSRDVRGFDGSSVLIPRGSRLVGQYRSGLSQGASRIFVIWTRVLRPDGVSVQIGSPGGDPLGRAGQEGKVHSHFFRQFADSILLSVINAEITNLAAQPSTQIIIGGAATGVASSAAPAAVTPAAGSAAGGAPVYPPTITVLQGAPISIFVARDLDFSAMQRPTR